MNDRAMDAGKVSTQAISMLRTVDHCRPEPLAAMVPATPDDSTCVVETGKPKLDFMFPLQAFDLLGKKYAVALAR
jgi:hypothetical protein